MILIIGILAAIAIPAFLGQRQKAQDSAGKSAARNATTAAEAYATDKGRDYSAMTIGDLQTIEPSLNDTNSVKVKAALVGTPDATGYTVTTQSKSDTYFTLTRTNGNTFRCNTGTAACTTNTW